MLRTCFTIILLFQFQTYYAQGIEIGNTNYNASIALYNEGLEWLLAETKMEEAVSNFNKAILLNPNNSDYYLALSQAHGHLGKSGLALMNILKAIELAPDQSDYHNEAATLYYKSKQYKKAVEHYTKAIKWNETSDIKINITLAYFNLGSSKLYLKDYQSAIEDFSESINMGNEFAGAYHNRGVALLKIEKKKEACIDFEKAQSYGSNISYKYLDRYCNK